MEAQTIKETSFLQAKEWAQMSRRRCTSPIPCPRTTPPVMLPYQSVVVALLITPVLINNFHGRQFNSLNDVAVHPLNGNIYFTDVQYGYLQDFRPSPGLPNQVYKLDAVTKAVTAVADGFVKCNGMNNATQWKDRGITYQV
jgi:hypothetical protein